MKFPWSHTTIMFYQVSYTIFEHSYEVSMVAPDPRHILTHLMRMDQLSRKPKPLSFHTTIIRFLTFSLTLQWSLNPCVCSQQQTCFLPHFQHCNEVSNPLASLKKHCLTLLLWSLLCFKRQSYFIKYSIPFFNTRKFPSPMVPHTNTFYHLFRRVSQLLHVELVIHHHQLNYSWCVSC